MLQEHGLSPRHRLGQNFLHDHNILSKLVDASDVQAGDVIEIVTGQPLGEHATFVLRGQEDGNAIQALRNALQDSGILYEPLMSVSSDGTITNDAGVPADFDLSPPVPPMPEEEAPSDNGPHP